MDQPRCPACGSRQHYLLSDNRRQCAVCRKKYSVGNHRGRLSPQSLQQLARSFWRLVPASAAAAEQGLNSKTLQRYYDLLRRAVTEASERDAIRQFGAAAMHPAPFHESAADRGVGRDPQPLFCVMQRGGRVSLLCAGEAAAGGPSAGTGSGEIAGWIYARDRRTLCSLDLDGIHLLPAGGPKGGAGATSFWTYAKKGLVRYHGGFRKNFRLFVREMEFRFNNQDEDAAVTFLLEILQRDRI